MDEIGNIALVENKLLGQLKEVFSNIRLAGRAEPSSLEPGLEMLKSLRHLVYEDMNQLQHEALILKTAKKLQNDFYPTTVIKWFWNPRQTGGKDEPDLRGVDQNSRIIVSAEITTSTRPQGLIDTRMATTLLKLSEMPADRYYVVATEEMERRAKSKIIKLGYTINVLRA